MTDKRLLDVIFYPKWDGAFLNCTLDYECEANWHKLTPTDRPHVRHCEACNRAVHFCTEQNQLNELAELGHCVAFYEARPTNKSPAALQLGLPKYLVRDNVAFSYIRQIRRLISNFN